MHPGDLAGLCYRRRLVRSLPFRPGACHPMDAQRQGVTAAGMVMVEAKRSLADARRIDARKIEPQVRPLLPARRMPTCPQDLIPSEVGLVPARIAVGVDMGVRDTREGKVSRGFIALQILKLTQDELQGGNFLVEHLNTARRGHVLIHPGVARQQVGWGLGSEQGVPLHASLPVLKAHQLILLQAEQGFAVLLQGERRRVRKNRNSRQHHRNRHQECARSHGYHPPSSREVRSSSLR